MSECSECGAEKKNPVRAARFMINSGLATWRSLNQRYDANWDDNGKFWELFAVDKIRNKLVSIQTFLSSHATLEDCEEQIEIRQSSEGR